MSHPSLVKLAQRGYLDAVIEVGFGMELWPIQRQICRAISKPMARVAVKSCNSSGKTAVGGALACAFYSVYPDSKVVTTSAREDQLRDNLWGEIRRIWAQRQVEFPGHMPPSGMTVRDGNRLLTGISPARPEGMKGYHSPHLLVIIDEASYLESEMAGAIATLLASGDARMLAIFNPSDSNTWIADQCETGAWEVIDIPAWETPHLKCMTNEEIQERWGVELPERQVSRIPIPHGASLITPFYLDDLVNSGKGPGSYEWETSVEARFWEHGLDTLVPREWYDKAVKESGSDGPVVFGVDLASYGDSESVVAIRRGNRLIDLVAQDKLRVDQFWHEVVAPLVDKYKPSYVVWDADGPGAGSYTDAEQVCGAAALPFRGSHSLSHDYANMRAFHYWNLHRRFEWNDIAITISDPLLRKQLTSITYQRRNGRLSVEQKADMRKRGLRHIDRADAVMYCYSADTPTEREPTITERDLKDRGASEDMFWKRREKTVKALGRSSHPAALR